MARRSPVEVDARRHALRDLLVDRKYRGDRNAAELLTSTAAGLAREAANMLVAGHVAEARRYARAHQLITESRNRLTARQQREREAQEAREAAEHGIQAGETVRVVRPTGGSDVPVGTVLTVDRVRGTALFTDGGQTRLLWARDVERVTVPESTYNVDHDVTTCACHFIDGSPLRDLERYDPPRTITAVAAGRDRNDNPITRRNTYVIDREPEPFGKGTSRIFAENRTFPDSNGGYLYTPAVVLTDSIEQTSTTGDDQ